MDKLEQMYKLVAGSGDYERFVEFLAAVHDHAADIRTPSTVPSPEGMWTWDDKSKARVGAVAILGQMIDKLQSARKNLNQQSRPLETEHD